MTTILRINKLASSLFLSGIVFGLGYTINSHATTAVVHKPTTYHNPHYHYAHPATVAPKPVVATPYHRPGYQCKTVCTSTANGGTHCSKRCG